MNPKIKIFFEECLKRIVILLKNLTYFLERFYSEERYDEELLVSIRNRMLKLLTVLLLQMEAERDEHRAYVFDKFGKKISPGRAYEKYSGEERAHIFLLEKSRDTQFHFFLFETYLQKKGITEITPFAKIKASSKDKKTFWEELIMHIHCYIQRVEALDNTSRRNTGFRLNKPVLEVTDHEASADYSEHHHSDHNKKYRTIEGMLEIFEMYGKFIDWKPCIDIDTRDI